MRGANKYCTINYLHPMHAVISVDLRVSLPCLIRFARCSSRSSATSARRLFSTQTLQHCNRRFPALSMWPNFRAEAGSDAKRQRKIDALIEAKKEAERRQRERASEFGPPVEQAAMVQTYKSTGSLDLSAITGQKRKLEPSHQASSSSSQLASFVPHAPEPHTAVPAAQQAAELAAARADAIFVDETRAADGDRASRHRPHMAPTPRSSLLPRPLLRLAPPPPPPPPPPRCLRLRHCPTGGKRPNTLTGVLTTSSRARRPCSGSGPRSRHALPSQMAARMLLTIPLPLLQLPPLPPMPALAAAHQPSQQ